MSLKIRMLKLVVDTEKGEFGTKLRFENGLNIFRADNSSGKSTCVQSIIYALGLEGMLSASHEVPLPHAMTDLIEVNGDGEEISVRGSEVYLEISNQQEEILTIQRTVKGERNKHLISTFEGPALTHPSNNYIQKDYFVRERGAAQREKGFHKKLADFLGWDIPEVLHYNGNAMLLYMECILPLMIIEQKRGWSAIQANTPKQYGIREVEKRAIEFILKLDANELFLEKQSLIERIKEYKTEWKMFVKQLKSISKKTDVTIEALPGEPTGTFSPKVLVEVDGKKSEISHTISELKKNLKHRSSDAIPKVKEDIRRVQQEIDLAAEAIVKNQITYNEKLEALQMERLQQKQTEDRLTAIEEDLQKYKDVRRIKQLGSLQNIQFTNGQCPTCHQGVTDTLLPQTQQNNPMSIDESINFLYGQKQTIKYAKENTNKVIELKIQELDQIRNKIKKLQQSVRDMKKTLISDERIPSVYELKERMRLEEDIKHYEETDELIHEIVEDMYELGELYEASVNKLNELPDNLVSRNDYIKLKSLEKIFKKHSKDYGLKSVKPETLSISTDTYKPIHDGFELSFDLQFDLSASDLIRMIWAYLISLLELSREFDSNHLGLLVFDEPRQQSTALESLREFLKDASKSRKNNQQVIFATSEEEGPLKELLDDSDIEHHYIGINGKILSKVENGGL
ncbi:hypothetical protein [Metabacillus idriensis]|uniref:hypothetical protein n=1 Tax=Metabacillus idriensis TaxID=324768 RepID=UPI001749AA68|nr:hypothetical protein [Metabacillus idriensis]